MADISMKWPPKKVAENVQKLMIFEKKKKKNCTSRKWSKMAKNGIHGLI